MIRVYKFLINFANEKSLGVCPCQFVCLQKSGERARDLKIGT